MYFQSTVAKRVDFEGVGIHSGEAVKVSLVPAPIDNGIVFKPAFAQGEEGIHAHVDNLLFTHNAITIGKNGFFVQTIEHFMAVFYALGISNLFVLVDGRELPILDGSSRDIVSKIEESGINNQNALQEEFHIPYPIWVENGGSYLIALPGNDFKVTYTIDFSSKSRAVGTQTAHYGIDRDTFVKSIAPSRTFGFFEDIETLKENKLARGGSLDNALIFTRENLINDSLRFADECVRHKVLDLIGDLSLIGCPLRGHFIAHKSGHTMDMELVKRIDRVIKRKRTSLHISRQILRKKEREFLRFKTRLNLS
jgi:UDP-3-O-[3-hydroxymyristoyl] N-acetylglucosamine deacetylase